MEPYCSRKFAYVVELAPGEHSWCGCGMSRVQPLCDGTHKECDLKPQKFTVATAGTYHLCGCRQSRTPPFCDATHEKLP